MTATDGPSQDPEPGPSPAPAAPVPPSAAPTPIERRRRAGRGLGVLLALGFAVLLTPIVLAEELLFYRTPLDAETPSPYSFRLPLASGHGLRLAIQPGRLLVARGERPSPDRARLANALAAEALRHGAAGAAGVLGGSLLAGILFVTFLRGTTRGRLLRVQAAVLGSFLLFALVTKTVLLMTGVAAVAVPVAALALLVVALSDRAFATACAIGLGLLGGALARYDASVALVLAAQGLGAVLGLGTGRRRRSALFAAIAGALTAAAAELTVVLVTGRTGELATLSATPLAAALGGALAGGLALLLADPVQRLFGEPPRARLLALADLEHPLLKQIATQSPGTWQHSLAMANMAESAAAAIGANGLLVRVGAYYHDLGKSLRPPFFIENLGQGQASPHDSLPPEESARAIFAHVVEGVALGRARGLPEAVVDFMHMHHGDGVLEYFWGKCQEQGNPDGLGPQDFRYPGVPPQSRETAILAICDAVEAASRTLKQPDLRAIEALVQRIVYGKLHLGQLDESGLTAHDLKAVAETLVATLAHAHHTRIEYPWQKEARLDAIDVTGPTQPGTVRADQRRAPPRRPTINRFLAHPLDSADAPRPGWADRPSRELAAVAPPNNDTDLEKAPTRELAIPSADEDAARLAEEAAGAELAPGQVILGPPPATRADAEPTLRTRLRAADLDARPSPSGAITVPRPAVRPPDGDDKA